LTHPCDRHPINYVSSKLFKQADHSAGPQPVCRDRVHSPGLRPQPQDRRSALHLLSRLLPAHPHEQQPPHRPRPPGPPPPHTHVLLHQRPLHAGHVLHDRRGAPGLVHVLSKKSALSSARGVAQKDVFLLFGATESWLLSVTSVDRYTAICRPLRYKVIVGCRTCLLVVGICVACRVVGGLSYTFFAVHLPHCGPDEMDHCFCEVPAVLKLACADTSLNDSVDFITGFNVVVVPLTLGVIVYANFFVSIMKIRSAQGRIEAFSPVPPTSPWAPCSPFHAASATAGSGSWSDSGKIMALLYNIATAFLNPSSTV
ncbi:olfactory receptor 2B6-like, partial [Ursus maritimus]|uniref:Olfactory receptor 2B6-like n=1 Tax=Ursus maritimus TaxID=29073 RepID=A0A8M1FSL8_URSMA